MLSTCWNQACFFDLPLEVSFIGSELSRDFFCPKNHLTCIKCIFIWKICVQKFLDFLKIILNLSKSSKSHVLCAYSAKLNVFLNLKSAARPIESDSRILLFQPCRLLSIFWGFQSNQMPYFRNSIPNFFYRSYFKQSSEFSENFLDDAISCGTRSNIASNHRIVRTCGRGSSHVIVIWSK